MNTDIPPKAPAVAGTAHTPTPWRASQDLPGSGHFSRTTFILAGSAEHPEIIADVTHHRYSSADRRTVDPLQREANIETIVRAVNHHDALVALVRLMANHRPYGDGPNDTQPDGEDAMLVLNHHIAAARAILQKLE